MSSVKLSKRKSDTQQLGLTNKRVETKLLDEFFLVKKVKRNNPQSIVNYLSVQPECSKRKIFNENNQQNSNYITVDANKLPLEILLHIFSYLPLEDFINVCQVNQGWRQASGSMLSLDLSSLSRKRKSTFPESLQNLVCQLRTLVLGPDWAVPPSVLLAANGSSLVRLDISGWTRFQDGLLRSIATHAPNLQILIWKDADVIFPKDLELLIEGKDEGIKKFLTSSKTLVGCKDLKYLDISGCRKFAINGLPIIFQNCLKLESLVAENLIFIDRWFSNIPEEIMKIMKSKAPPSLKEFKFSFGSAKMVSMTENVNSKIM